MKQTIEQRLSILEKRIGIKENSITMKDFIELVHSLPTNVIAYRIKFKNSSGRKGYFSPEDYSSKRELLKELQYYLKTREVLSIYCIHQYSLKARSAKVTEVFLDGTKEEITGNIV